MAFNATEATMDETSVTESIVCYAERETAAERNVLALEDQINKSEIRNHQPPSQISYYKPERTYYTPHQPAPGISTTINVPPPVPDPMDRTSGVSSTGTTLKEESLKRIPMGRPPTCLI